MSDAQKLHDRVGEMLVHKGLITDAQLSEALGLQKEKPYLRIGEVLLGLGYLTLDHLDTALELQHRALRLGQILVRKGELAPEHLEEALRLQSQSGRLLGEILIDHGFCSRAQIEGALEYQRRHPFYRHAGSAAVPAPQPQG